MPPGKLDKGEPVPEGFQITKHSELYRTLDEKLTSIVDAEVRSNETPFKTEGIKGFDNLFHGGTLGHGESFATYGTRPQLLFALSLAPQAPVLEVVNDETLSAEKKIKKLQEKQVLAGMRIIDLGSGRHSYFARAARSLGATVFSVDIEDVRFEVKESGITHIQADLRDPDAAAKILKESGGNFDLVTEALVGPLGGQSSRIAGPDKKHLVAIARENLKKGGYLCSQLVDYDMQSMLRRT